jgi:hypothetical protein
MLESFIFSVFSRETVLDLVCFFSTKYILFSALEHYKNSTNPKKEVSFYRLTSTQDHRQWYCGRDRNQRMVQCGGGSMDFFGF